MGNRITIHELKEREMRAFSAIPGMKELLQSSPADRIHIQMMYPDAVFAESIATSLFNHNRELSLISQRAYFSILNGESISSVRFRYNRDIDEYWKNHMWDD